MNKIIVWGTGAACAKLLDSWIQIESIYAFVDSKPVKSFFGKKVMSPEELLDEKFDAIIVASTYSKEIYKKCIELGLDMKKLFLCLKVF